MSFVGYAHLHQSLGLKAIAPTRAAMIKPVTRISIIGDCLAVPQAVAPVTGAVLDHILFALKHEGINLGILAQALETVSADQLLNELDKAPNGVFIRKVCYLWEGLTLQQLNYSKPINSRVSPLFDPQRYVTGPSTRNSR